MVAWCTIQTKLGFTSRIVITFQGFNFWQTQMCREKRINLPPLVSIKGGRYSLTRVGNKKFKENDLSSRIRDAGNLRGILWVDENKEEYVVVWFFLIRSIKYLAFWKNGNSHYSVISTYIGLRTELQGVFDMVLHGYNLYVLTTGKYIRLVDLSGREGFNDVSADKGLIPMWSSSEKENTLNITVTRSGEVLLVQTILDETSYRTFQIYKKDPV
ncbi:unnamed protein product [Arabis nemorensis]|uniref:KIB1-4 beta-propeller domain-containing protein n=1 Tax=Arabis nemorensis TaxID=586526 RepID=A0A565CUC5_9BRAS|nr:unnamed protein product [Arabis nemorensis]